MVELALFHAERDPYFQLMRDAPPQPRSRRRKVRKPVAKKGKAAASNASPEEKASENTAAASTNDDATTMAEDNSKLSDREGEPEVDVQSEAVSEEINGEETNLDVSEDATPMDEAEGGRPAPVAEARLPRPRLRWDSGEQATCFQWLPDLFQDGSHFQLMQYRHRDAAESNIPVARAFVRNTFVHVEVLEEHGKDSELRRSASERILG